MGGRGKLLGTGSKDAAVDLESKRSCGKDGLI